MEYVNGEPLEDAIDRYPRGLPLEQVLYWIHGIGSGVNYLHDHGIVHRDMKPGNVFQDESLVKIGDYGLSKFITASRRSGQTESVGTVHYMAPEVANGRYGKQIDIYALGIMLYEMLTGRVPFEGESVGEVLMKHLTAQPDLDALDEPFKTVVGRALDKDPDQRFQNVGEMLAMLPPPPEGTMQAQLAGVPHGEKPHVVNDAPGSGAAQRDPARRGAGANHTAQSGDRGNGPATGAAAGVGNVFLDAMEADRALLHDEPIFCAVRDVVQEGHEAWQRADLPVVMRVLLIALFIFMLITTAGIWTTALVIYGIYFVVRALVVSIIGSGSKKSSFSGFATDRALEVMHGSGPPPVPPVGLRETKASSRAREDSVVLEPPAEYVAGPVRHHRRTRRRHHEKPSSSVTMPIKSARLRFTELLGSMLLGAAVSAALTIVAFIIMKSNQPEQFAWIAVVGTLGTWAVMLPSKVWEGNSLGDDLTRRFVLAAFGLGLGFASYALDRSLTVGMPYNPSFTVQVVDNTIHQVGQNSEIVQQFRASLFDEHGAPTLGSFILFFGSLFLITRWWRLADPMRAHRVSLFAIVPCVLMAWLMEMVWEFPDGWGVTQAIIIALSVQMASPWFDRRSRQQTPARAA
jgi:hypothetical protein